MHKWLNEQMESLLKKEVFFVLNKNTALTHQHGISAHLGSLGILQCSSC